MCVRVRWERTAEGEGFGCSHDLCPATSLLMMLLMLAFGVGLQLADQVLLRYVYATTDPTSSMERMAAAIRCAEDVACYWLHCCYHSCCRTRAMTCTFSFLFLFPFPFLFPFFFLACSVG